MSKTVYRVFSMPREIHARLARARSKRRLTTQIVVASAIANHLQDIEGDFGRAGLPLPKGASTKVRVPFARSTQTLDLIAKASKRIRIPATTLLLLCVGREVESGRAAVRERRPSSDAKRPRRRRASSAR
jgi:hypothetical protein